MEVLREYWPFLIPLLLLQIALAITALVHVLRHERYRWGSRGLWILLVLFIQVIGPVLYFTTGRSDD